MLKLTAPGIPDIYQGDELPYRALVDPDNRRPVDWDWRQAMLRRLMGGSPPVAETRKLFLIAAAAGAPRPAPRAVRRRRYEPLDAGPAACAFVRGGEVLVVVGLPGRRRRSAGALHGPAGRTLARRAPRRGALVRPARAAGTVVGDYGIAVFERLSCCARSHPGRARVVVP